MIIGLAAFVAFLPSVEARGREAHDPEHRAQRQDTTGTLDGFDDGGSALGVEVAAFLERTARCADEYDEQTDDGGDHAEPAAEPQHLGLQLYLAHGEKDVLMPVEEMRTLAAALAGKSNVIYVEIEGGDHDSPCFYPPAMEWLLEQAKARP